MSWVPSGVSALPPIGAYYCTSRYLLTFPGTAMGASRCLTKGQHSLVPESLEVRSG